MILQSLEPPAARSVAIDAPAKPSWFESLSFCLIITAASHAIPRWVWFWIIPQSWLEWSYRHSLADWLYDGLMLAFCLFLCLPTPLRCGLRIGRIRAHGWQTILVMAVPIVLTALIYPRLPQHPLKGMSASIWAISPLAQDLLISGYIYSRFELLAPRRIHPRVPINGAMLPAALYFSLWHIPNYLGWPVGFVTFQLCYVFLGSLWVGMTRLWTGSILYITITHMAVNAVALYTS